MDGLTGVRALAQSFLKSAAWQGLSANETIRQLAASGLGTYRRATMLADFKTYSDMPRKAAQLYQVAFDRRPTKALFTENLGKQFSRYKYQVDITGVNHQTGQSYTMSTNITSDSQLTRRQVESAGVDAVYSIFDSYKQDIEDVRMSVAYHRAGDTWD